MHVTMFLFIFEIHFGNPHSVFKLIGEIMKWIFKYLSLGWFSTCLSLSPTFFLVSRLFLGECGLSIHSGRNRELEAYPSVELALGNVLIKE